MRIMPWLVASFFAASFASGANAQKIDWQFGTICHFRPCAGNRLAEGRRRPWQEARRVG